MTVQELVTTSLRALSVVQSGETPSPDESSDALGALNRMIGSWNEILERVLAGSYASILYTFTPIATFSTLGQTITLPLGWQRALIYNLAVELAPEYGRQIDAVLAGQAQNSRAAVMTLPAPPVAG